MKKFLKWGGYGNKFCCLINYYLGVKIKHYNKKGHLKSGDLIYK